MKVTISKNLFIVTGLDAVIICLSFYLAHVFRFDFAIPEPVWRQFWKMLPLVIMAKSFCLYWFDAYKGMWRYTGTKDVISLVKAGSFASAGLMTLFLFINRFHMLSRSVFLIDWFVSLILLISLRVAIRLFFEEFTEQFSIAQIRQTLKNIFFPKKEKGKGVIIIGAGDLGQRICREFIENPYMKSHVEGFLDDDSSKLGRKIHGVPVLGRVDHLPSIVRITGAKDVVIAISRIKPENMRRIIEICRKAGVDFKTVPNMGEIIDGRLRISTIRKVEYKDLLGREEILLDEEKIGGYLRNKTVLVTGAGGSIGAGLCRQICLYQPKQIILFERAESPLYEIDLTLQHHFSEISVIPVLGDILDKKELRQTFEDFSPEIIFHAAAYKHVPMLETCPWKAVEHIIGGTRNLLEAAGQFHTEKLVFISTDKAVNPVNVMGASKRVAEILVQQANDKYKGKTCNIIVRFGNVIGSAGSVIPLLKRQINQGGPVTITHKDMVRYFMLISEACRLILQAGAMGKEGQVFILDMGEPVNIEAMARDLIRFSGMEPDRDIKIEYTGLRPGEKLQEELMGQGENVLPSSHDKILVLNTVEPKTGTSWEQSLTDLFQAAEQRNPEKIRGILQDLVPEYHP